jgi:hypothetical protein
MTRHSCLTLVALLLVLAPVHAEDLLIANVAMRAHTVVYELPVVPPAQARMLAGAMQQKFPQAEVIDAAAASESELREKLKKSFLLVTLLDANSRLLPLVAQPLPLKLEGGTLRWDDFAAPAKDLRVDFIGRNPYGVGYSVVLAVGSPALLQGGDEGQYSYTIRNSDGILRKGTYDEEFTPTTHGRLKAADARADVREFFDTLERIHPDPFARVTEPDYRHMKDQTFAGLEARTGKDGQVSMEDLAYLLRYAAAFIRDGHTEMGWGARPYQEPMDNRRFPPFRFEFENGRFFITGANDPSLVGLELVAVNGAPAAEFLSPALDRIAGEILTWRATRLADNQDFWMWFTNLVGKTESCCKLRLRDANGAESDRTVEPVTLSQFGKIRVTAGRKFPARNGTQVRFFDSGRVAQFVYPAFRYSDAEKQKIDDIFRQIREAKSQDVIVDMRSNGGGESLMGSLIFSYLSPEPVELFQSGRIRISPEAMQNLITGLPLADEGQLLSGSDTDAIAKEIASAFAGMKQMPKQREPFSGRVWLLVDHRTFSAANLFSEAFRNHRLGKVLGYETGEPANIGGGIVISFTLKHSGIPYRVSASQNYVSKLVPGAVEHGVLPDVPFDRKALSPFHNEPDPELAFTLDYIQKHR